MCEVVDKVLLGGSRKFRVCITCFISDRQHSFLCPLVRSSAHIGEINLLELNYFDFKDDLSYRPPLSASGAGWRWWYVRLVLGQTLFLETVRNDVPRQLDDPFQGAEVAATLHF